MLTTFDWLRRCRTGAELLATLHLLTRQPDCLPEQIAPGPPFSAFGGPCLRCKIYEPVQENGKVRRYCQFCGQVISSTKHYTFKSPYCVIVWGYLNRIPRQLCEIKVSQYIYGIYLHDQQRFLLSMHRHYLREWLQELVIYYGSDLIGLIQVFPTLGEWRNLNMGDYLSWAIHHEANLPMTQLRVRFFTEPHQLINPKVREQKGLLTFTVPDFLALLEMATVFRANLRLDEQKQLFELLQLTDATEEQFYWGRFLGQLAQPAKDMLAAWKIRQWPANRIKLLYELVDYVVIPKGS